MHDPLPAPSSVYEFSRPYCEALHLKTLPFHVHEVLISFAFYTIVQKILSPWLSTYFFPSQYPKFPRRTKVNWDIHFTAFIQSIIICTAVIIIMCVDTRRIGNTWEDRIWGYTGAAGLVQGMAAGYFLWDLMVCVTHIELLSPLDLTHAFTALSVAFLGFRPFALYYGMAYLLFEISSPFVNIHWFLDKVDMTGTKAQLYNGIALIVTFFCCRLVYGSYLSFVFFSDLWTAFKTKEVLTRPLQFSATAKPIRMEHSIPFWFGPAFLLLHTTLMALNFYWFSKMIEAVRKRFTPVPKDQASRKSFSQQIPRHKMTANGGMSEIRRRTK